jgi:hypothetical protein
VETEHWLRSIRLPPPQSFRFCYLPNAANLHGCWSLSSRSSFSGSAM